MAAGTNAPRPCGRMGSLPHLPPPRSTASPPAALSHPSRPHCPRARTPRLRRRAQGEIVEGSESEVRAAIFVVALVREVDATTGALAWRAAEISFNAGSLFL